MGFVIQLLLILVLTLGGGSYYLYTENGILKENVMKLENAVEEQKAAMKAMKDSFETQSKALTNLQQRNAEIEAEKDQYLSIFRRHNLDKLALLKPGLIEKRLNSGTKKVFEDLENDSKNISNINSNDSN